MNIIEVKNNLVKFCYEEDISLSCLILIKDNNKSYIAQVLHLESTRVGKIAIAKILFNYSDKIYAYDGTVPSLRAELSVFNSANILESECSNPVILGKLSGTSDNLKADFDIFKDFPIILAEKFYVTKVLLNNIAIQLQARKNKIVVFDTAGVFKSNKLTVTKDFKLPLNTSTINYIYEKGFEDATAESKSMIQAIFEELGEYSKTVEFIPFDTFKAVVDSEFMRTKLMQLVIMKNKIKQIRDWGVFAQTENEFKIVKTKLEKENTVVLDISCLKESLQKECIKYVYSVMNDIDAEFYAFTPVNSNNSDKFLLDTVFNTENVHTSLICDYDYADLSELKKRSKNMLMFTPLKQQKDFGGYNIFLQKLAEDEFIAYGKMTKFVPLIGKLAQLSSEDIYVPQIKETITTIVQQTEPEQEEIVETKVVEKVVEEVNETIEPVTEPEEEISQPVAEDISEIPEETYAPAETQDDTPEAINTETEEANKEEVISEETAVETEEQIEPSEVTEPIETIDTQPTAISDEPIAEEVVDSVEQPNVSEYEVGVETAQAPQIEEITAPEAETISTPEVAISAMAGASAESVEVKPSEPIVAQAPEDVIVSEPENNDVEAALNEVPDAEDDEELSDDDLDMIEELSKPDEEIPIINQEPETAPVAQPQPDIEEAMPIEQPVAEEEEQVPQPEAEPAAEEYAPVEQPVDEEVQNASMPTQVEPVQARTTKTPVVPEYSAEIPEEDRVQSDVFQQGDKVFHQEFGEGVVEKMINYGDKLLCSVNFTNVGRRLLNPEVSEMRKV